MKKLMQTMASLILAMAMIFAPAMDAQTRGRQGAATPAGQHSRPGASQGRPSGNHRPEGNRPGNNRPGNNNHRPGNNRPGNNNHRPGNNRPGGDRPGNNRPGNRPGEGFRPGNGHNRPGADRPGNHRPGHDRPGFGNHRPGHGDYRPGWGNHHRPPMPPARPPRHHHGFRHHVPFFNGYRRPLPPPAWRWHAGGPAFGTILGLTLGTSIGLSISALANSGYSVSSYGDDVVYLNNVPQMNYNWPDAALYYTDGRLCGSQFTYATDYYDMGRYNALYNTFLSRYGTPVGYSNSGGSVSANWFGADGRYVTLSFVSANGAYYTTLSFGN